MTMIDEELSESLKYSKFRSLLLLFSIFSFLLFNIIAIIFLSLSFSLSSSFTLVTILISHSHINITLVPDVLHFISLNLPFIPNATCISLTIQVKLLYIRFPPPLPSLPPHSPFPRHFSNCSIYPRFGFSLSR